MAVFVDDRIEDHVGMLENPLEFSRNFHVVPQACHQPMNISEASQLICSPISLQTCSTYELFIANELHNCYE